MKRKKDMNKKNPCSENRQGFFVGGGNLILMRFV